MEKKVLKSYLSVILSLVSCFALLFPLAAHGIGLTLPFGGQIKYVDYATCDCNYVRWMNPRIITVKETTGKTSYYVVNIFSQLYKYANVNAGVNVLGLVVPGPACWKQAGLACAPAGYYPWVYMMGTSKK